MERTRPKNRAGKHADELAGADAGARESDGAAGAAADAGPGAEVAAGERGPADGDDAGAAGASSGPLGVVAVEVDRAAILAEAEAAAASSSSAPIAPTSSAPVGLDVQAKAADVAPAVRLLVAQCCGAFAPNWEITQGEADGIGDAAALVMAHWMPDGVLEPKYVALVTLAAALYGVADKRRRDDGTFKPLRAPRAPASSSPPTVPGPANGAPLKLV